VLIALAGREVADDVVTVSHQKSSWSGGTLDLVPAQRVMLRKTVRTLALCSEVSGEAAMSATQGKAAWVWAVGKRKSRRTLAG